MTDMETAIDIISIIAIIGAVIYIIQVLVRYIRK